MSELLNYPVQDTVSFVVSAEHTIVNNTTKLVAHIVALVAGETTEDELRKDIKATMKKLVDADWQFSGMYREADQSGWERVSLTASVRVNESENYNLDSRAKEASRKGLTITSVTTDSSVPLSMISDAESILRKQLIEKMLEEKGKIQELLGNSYRVGKLSFVPPQFGNSNRNIAASVGATKIAYGSGFSDESVTLGNASKLSMQLQVVLSRSVRM